MPMYNFVCPNGHKIRTLSLHPQLPFCVKCGGQLFRDPQPPTVQTIERLDNGVSPRAVERLVNAEQLYKERVNKK